MPAFCVSECCPVGCGIPVVLLKARDSGKVFCYCHLCGCSWDTPAETQLDAGLWTCTPAEIVAPSGVELPTHAEVALAGLADGVLCELSDTEWYSSTERINKHIAGRVASGS